RQDRVPRRLGPGGLERPLCEILFQGRRQGRRSEDSLGRQQGRDRHHHGENPVMRVRPILLSAAAALAFAALASIAASAIAAPDGPDPVADARAFKKFFTDKFPKVKFEDFVNGPYSMNEDMHKQWEEKEEFPPYEFALEAGKEMFAKPFKNGKTY